MKQLVVFLYLAALGVGGLAWWKTQNANASAPGFRSTAVEQGNLVASISATGTLEPEEFIDVGAQVAGRIIKFGDDPKDPSKKIDYNSEVKEGTVLAEIDKRLYKADVDQSEGMLQQTLAQEKSAESQLTVAKANVERAKADLEQMRSRLVQNDREWTRNQRLAVQPGAVSDQDFDTAKANYETARATVGVGEATVKQTEATIAGAKADLVQRKAAVVSARAALDKAKTNLEYCTITSPVNGTIIDRRVNVGQTVVSSLNAPSLFLIAKDLRKIQIWTSVNEADVEQIRIGQKARFTLDGIPGRVFTGEVTQIRLNATVTQNVVTYTVIVTTDNKDGALKVYRTANVTFEIDKRQDVLKVANAALRWQPRPETVDSAYQDELAQLTRQRIAQKAGSEKEQKDGVVWVETSSGKVRPVIVTTGLSDGQMTEIIPQNADELKTKDRVVVGIQQGKSNGEDPNPFAPKMFGPGTGGKKP